MKSFVAGFLGAAGALLCLGLTSLLMSLVAFALVRRGARGYRADLVARARRLIATRADDKE